MFRRFIRPVSALLIASAALLGSAGSAMAATAYPTVQHPAAGCDTHRCYT